MTEIQAKMVATGNSLLVVFTDDKDKTSAKSSSAAAEHADKDKTSAEESRQYALWMAHDYLLKNEMVLMDRLQLNAVSVPDAYKPDLGLHVTVVCEKEPSAELVQKMRKFDGQEITIAMEDNVSIMPGASQFAHEVGGSFYFVRSLTPISIERIKSIREELGVDTAKFIPHLSLAAIEVLPGAQLPKIPLEQLFNKRRRLLKD